MEEQTYNVMKKSGVVNVVAGIVSIVAGVTFGTLLIVSGSKLLSGKKNIIF